MPPTALHVGSRVMKKAQWLRDLTLEDSFTPIPIMIKRFSIFLEFCDTPPNPKSKNHNSDYHIIITSREVMKTSEIIIKV